MRPYWMKVGPNPITVSLQEDGNLDPEAHREEGHVKKETEIGATLHKPNPWVYQKQGRVLR